MTGILDSRAFRRACAAVLAAALPCAAQVSPADQIRRWAEELRSSGRIQLAGQERSVPTVLATAYEETGFSPLWSDTGAQAALRQILVDVEADGLQPSYYRLAAIDSLSSEPSSPVGAASLDVLRTLALIDLVHDLQFGRARPPLPDIGPEFAPAGREIDAAEVRRLIASDNLGEEIARFRPRHFVYRGLAAALARARAIAAVGGWGRVEEGSELSRDALDARVPSLRRRLAVEGYLAADDTASPIFEAALELAVRAFQHRQGLNEDGVVGRSTAEELNVPVERRIEQLRVNLERARWLGRDLPDAFVGVNTAAAKVYLVRGGAVVFETRAIVGKAYTETPDLSSAIRTIELNPTWTVPKSIVEEILPDIQRDAGYLGRERFRLLNPAGEIVEADTIDFSQYSATEFPYTLRQETGPTNPLGRIKFLFPNRYDVYLHDTSDPELFGREARAFSHGCIRLADPLQLGALLLEDQSGWSREAIDAAIELGGTQTILLERAVPVLVFYWTASADEAGDLHLYRDAYGRDEAILNTLGAER